MANMYDFGNGDGASFLNFWRHSRQRIQKRALPVCSKPFIEAQVMMDTCTRNTTSRSWKVSRIGGARTKRSLWSPPTKGYTTDAKRSYWGRLYSWHSVEELVASPHFAHNNWPQFLNLDPRVIRLALRPLTSAPLNLKQRWVEMKNEWAAYERFPRNKHEPGRDLYINFENRFFSSRLPGRRWN